MSLYCKTLKQLGFEEATLHQNGKGRISNFSAISRQLFKAHFDGYHPRMSRQLATAVKRYINTRPKYEKRTQEFVNDVRRKILCLHEYNLQIAQVKYKYPRSEQFDAILMQYVELECGLLYDSTTEVNPEEEQKVVERILRLLRLIVCDAHNNSDVLAKTSIELSDKALLKLFGHLSADFICENRVVAAIVVKLLSKLNLLEEVNKLKGRNVPFQRDSFLKDPLVATIRQCLASSDYESDLDDEDDDLIINDEQFCSSMEIFCFPYKEEVKNIDLDKFRLPETNFYDSTNLSNKENQNNVNKNTDYSANNKQKRDNFLQFKNSENTKNCEEKDDRFLSNSNPKSVPSNFLLNSNEDVVVENNGWKQEIPQTSSENINSSKAQAELKNSRRQTSKPKSSNENSSEVSVVEIDDTYEINKTVLKTGKITESLVNNQTSSQTVDLDSIPDDNFTTKKINSGVQNGGIITIDLLDDDDEEDSGINVNSVNDNQILNTNLLQVNEIKQEENEENRSPNFPVSNTDNDQNFLNSDKSSRNSNSDGFNKMGTNSNDCAKEMDASAIIISDSEDELVDSSTAVEEETVSTKNKEVDHTKMTTCETSDKNSEVESTNETVIENSEPNPITVLSTELSNETVLEEFQEFIDQSINTVSEKSVVEISNVQTEEEGVPADNHDEIEFTTGENQLETEMLDSRNEDKEDTMLSEVPVDEVADSIEQTEVASSKLSAAESETVSASTASVSFEENCVTEEVEALQNDSVEHLTVEIVQLPVERNVEEENIDTNNCENSYEVIEANTTQIEVEVPESSNSLESENLPSNDNNEVPQTFSEEICENNNVAREELLTENVECSETNFETLYPPSYTENFVNEETQSLQPLQIPENVCEPVNYSVSHLPSETVSYEHEQISQPDYYQVQDKLVIYEAPSPQLQVVPTEPNIVSEVLPDESIVQNLDNTPTNTNDPLSFLADVASNREILTVQNANEESDLTQTPKRRKSKIRFERKKKSSARQVLPRAVKKPQVRQLVIDENKRITRNMGTKAKIDVLKDIPKQSKMTRNEDAKYKPHDFITVENSTLSPITNNVFAQKRLIDTNTTSEDSNDSCESTLIIDLGEKVDKTIFDEDTIWDNLEFIKTEDKSTVCISIPENAFSLSLDNFHILKQMEDFVDQNKEKTSCEVEEAKEANEEPYRSDLDKPNPIESCNLNVESEKDVSDCDLQKDAVNCVSENNIENEKDSSNRVSENNTESEKDVSNRVSENNTESEKDVSNCVSENNTESENDAVNCDPENNTESEKDAVTSDLEKPVEMTDAKNTAECSIHSEIEENDASNSVFESSLPKLSSDELKTPKTTNHSIEHILNKVEPINKSPETEETQNISTELDVSRVESEILENVDSDSEFDEPEKSNELDKENLEVIRDVSDSQEVVSVETPEHNEIYPEKIVVPEIEVNQAENLVIRDFSIHDEKAFKTKAAMKSYEDKLQKPILENLNEIRTGPRLRSRSSDLFSETSGNSSVRSRSISVDCNNLSDSSFNQSGNSLETGDLEVTKSISDNEISVEVKSAEVVEKIDSLLDLTSKEIEVDNSRVLSDISVYHSNEVISHSAIETDETLPKVLEKTKEEISLSSDSIKNLETEIVPESVENIVNTIEVEEPKVDDFSDKLIKTESLPKKSDKNEKVSSKSRSSDEMKGRTLENTIKTLKEKIQASEKAVSDVEIKETEDVKHTSPKLIDKITHIPNESEKKHHKKLVLDERPKSTDSSKDDYKKRRSSRSPAKSKDSDKERKSKDSDKERHSNKDRSRSSSKFRSSDKKSRHYSDNESERNRRSSSKSSDDKSKRSSSYDANGHKKHHDKSSKSKDDKGKHKNEKEYKKGKSKSPPKTKSHDNKEKHVTEKKKSGDKKDETKKKQVEDKSRIKVEESDKKNSDNKSKPDQKSSKEKSKKLISVMLGENIKDVDQDEKKEKKENKIDKINEKEKSNEKESKTEKLNEKESKLEKLNEKESKPEKSNEKEHKTEKSNNEKENKTEKTNDKEHKTDKSNEKEHKREKSNEKEHKLEKSNEKEKHKESSKSKSRERKEKSKTNHDEKHDSHKEDLKSRRSHSKDNHRSDNKRDKGSSERHKQEKKIEEMKEVDVLKRKDKKKEEEKVCENNKKRKDEEFTKEKKDETNKNKSRKLNETDESIKSEEKREKIDVSKKRKSSCSIADEIPTKIPKLDENIANKENKVEELQKVSEESKESSDWSLEGKEVDSPKTDVFEQKIDELVPAKDSSFLSSEKELITANIEPETITHNDDSCSSDMEICENVQTNISEGELSNKIENSTVKIILQNQIDPSSTESVPIYVSAVFSSSSLVTPIDTIVKHPPGQDSDLSLNPTVSAALTTECIASTSSSVTQTVPLENATTSTDERQSSPPPQIFHTQIGLEDISPTKLPLDCNQSLDFISPSTSIADISNSMNLVQPLETSSINFEVPDTSEIDIQQSNKQNSFCSNFVTRVTEISCYVEKESNADHNYTVGDPLLGGNNEEKSILSTGLSLRNSPEEFLNESQLDDLSFGENNFIGENGTLEEFGLLPHCKKEKPDFDTIVDDPIPKPEDIQDSLKHLNMLMDNPQSSQPKTNSNDITHMINSSITDLGFEYAVSEILFLRDSEVSSQNNSFSKIQDIENISITESDDSAISPIKPSSVESLKNKIDETNTLTSLDTNCNSLPPVCPTYTNFSSEKVIVQPIEHFPITSVDQLKNDFVDESKKDDKNKHFNKSDNGKLQPKRHKRFATFLEDVKRGAKKVEPPNVKDEMEVFTLRRYNRTPVVSTKKKTSNQSSPAKSPSQSSTKPQEGRIRVKTDLIKSDSNSESLLEPPGHIIANDKPVAKSEEKKTESLPKVNSKHPRFDKKGNDYIMENILNDPLHKSEPKQEGEKISCKKRKSLDESSSDEKKTKKANEKSSNSVSSPTKNSTNNKVSTDEIFDALRREGPVNKEFIRKMEEQKKKHQGEPSHRTNAISKKLLAGINFETNLFDKIAIQNSSAKTTEAVISTNSDESSSSDLEIGKNVQSKMSERELLNKIENSIVKRRNQIDPSSLVTPIESIAQHISGQATLENTLSTDNRKNLPPSEIFHTQIGLEAISPTKLPIDCNQSLDFISPSTSIAEMNNSINFELPHTSVDIQQTNKKNSFSSDFMTRVNELSSFVNKEFIRKIEEQKKKQNLNLIDPLNRGYSTDPYTKKDKNRVSQTASTTHLCDSSKYKDLKSKKKADNHKSNSHSERKYAEKSQISASVIDPSKQRIENCGNSHDNLFPNASRAHQQKEEDKYSWIAKISGAGIFDPQPNLFMTPGTDRGDKSS